MRRFRLTQDIECSADEHWRIYFDDAFERDLYQHLRFPTYELLESRDEENRVVRRIRVTPRLEVPAAVAKVLGPSFGYVEDGTFDKRSKTWRSRIIPNVLADRISCDLTVTCEETGPARSRRIVDGNLEARIFAIGGLVESAFEKSLRDGWEKSAAYLNEVARRTKAT